MTTFQFPKKAVETTVASVKIDRFLRILAPYPNKIREKEVILKAWKGANRTPEHDVKVFL